VFIPPLPANIVELRTGIIAQLQKWHQRCYVACRKNLATGGMSDTLPVEVTSITNPGKTRCVLLHYDCSKHCTCPLNKFIHAFKVVKLFLKHQVQRRDVVYRD
jgi:hypothetical protein